MILVIAIVTLVVNIILLPGTAVYFFFYLLYLLINFRKIVRHGRQVQMEDPGIPEKELKSKMFARYRDRMEWLYELVPFISFVFWVLVLIKIILNVFHHFFI